MKAIQIEVPHKISYIDVPRPKARPGEALLKIETSGLCHTDVNIYEGNFHAEYPVIPGHEFAGTVVEVGPGVNPDWVGKPVVVDPNVPCGLCPACHSNHQNQCRTLDAYGVTVPGGFAEYAAVKESNIHLLKNVPFDRAVFAEPLACVLHALTQIPRYPGGRALIFGAGPMGLLMLQSLPLIGISSVAMVDLHSERLRIGKELGARQVLTDVEAKSHNEQYDVVVDATGVLKVIEGLPTFTATSGSIIYFGVANPKDRITIEPYDIYRRDIRIAGAFSLKAGIRQALNLLQDNFVVVDKLITHRLQLNQFASGIDLVGKASVLKIIVEF